MPEIIDISLPITPDMPVYPGTAATQIKQVRSASGSSILSEITMTSHAGTHIDAPSHALLDDQGIDSLALELFYGGCRVLDLTHCTVAITEDDLKQHDIQTGERVLFKTSNSLRGFDEFYDDYVYLDSQAARYLGELGIKLVGIDALSVKQRGAQDNTAHTALLSQGIPIIEGLNLSPVEPGEYTLSALPLAFKGIDGSPTRAVLIKYENSRDFGGSLGWGNSLRMSPGGYIDFMSASSSCSSSAKRDWSSRVGSSIFMSESSRPVSSSRSKS